MAGERRSSSSSSSSPSRLSPLAPPFTINRSTRPPNLNLLAQSGDHPYASFTSWHPTTPFAAFPDDHPLETNPYYPHFSSAVFNPNSPLSVHNNQSDFDALSTSIVIPLDEPSATNYLRDSCKNKSAVASSVNTSFLKKGAPAAEGSQTCLVTSASWCGKYTGILGRDGQFGSSGTEQIDAGCLSFPVENPNATTSKILASSVICSAAIPQEVLELQVPYPAQVVNSLGHDNTNAASYESCLSQLNSNTAYPTGFQSSENNSFPAQVIGLSGGSITLLAPRPVLSENYNSSGNVTVNSNENSSSCTTSNLMGPDIVQNSKGKEVYRVESVIGKGKEIIDHILVGSSLTDEGEFSNEKPVSDVAMDSLLLEKSELRVRLPNLLDEFPYESHCAERVVSNENSSAMFDKYDSDVDSPCWKGTLALRSLVEVSGPANSQRKNELEASKRLNPLAPQFFPRNAEGSLYNRGNECCGADLLAFRKSTYSVVKSSSEEHGLRDAVEAGSCLSKVSSGVWPQCFDDIREPRKECATLNNSNSTSEINSSQMIKPSVVEDYFSSKEKFVIGANVSGSVIAIKDTAQNSSSCVPFLATEHGSDVPSSGGSIPTEIMETLGGAFNSLSTPPIIDIQIVVNALHNLSELLVRNCSSDLDSLKEHDQDILQHVINNLYFYIRMRGGEMTRVFGTPHPVTSYCPKKSTDFHQGTVMGFQVRRTKAVTAQHKLEPEKRKSFSTVYSERDYRVLDSFASSSDVSIEKTGNMSQVIEKVLKGNHQIEEDMHPQVLLYKNLWLEAEAALCSMKYKDCDVRMKTKMDKCKLDIKYG